MSDSASSEAEDRSEVAPAEGWHAETDLLDRPDVSRTKVVIVVLLLVWGARGMAALADAAMHAIAVKASAASVDV